MAPTPPAPSQSVQNAPSNGKTVNSVQNNSVGQGQKAGTVQGTSGVSLQPVAPAGSKPATTSTSSNTAGPAASTASPAQATGKDASGVQFQSPEKSPLPPSVAAVGPQSVAPNPAQSSPVPDSGPVGVAPPNQAKIPNTATSPQDGPLGVVAPSSIANPKLPPVSPNGNPTGVAPPPGFGGKVGINAANPDARVDPEDKAAAKEQQNYQTQRTSLQKEYEAAMRTGDAVLANQKANALLQVEADHLKFLDNMYGGNRSQFIDPTVNFLKTWDKPEEKLAYFNAYRDLVLYGGQEVNSSLADIANAARQGIKDKGLEANRTFARGFGPAAAKNTMITELGKGFAALFRQAQISQTVENTFSALFTSPYRVQGLYGQTQQLLRALADYYRENPVEAIGMTLALGGSIWIAATTLPVFLAVAAAEGVALVGASARLGAIGTRWIGPLEPAAKEPIYFGQVRIGERFATINSPAPNFIRGRLISEVAQDLRDGKINPDDVLINVFRDQTSGKLVAINNNPSCHLKDAG